MPAHCTLTAFARVAESADAYGSGPYGETRGGSSPLASIKRPVLLFNQEDTKTRRLMKGYFAAFLLAAQRAFISSESFLLPAGVSAPFFLTGVAFLPADFLRAAQRAFISWDSFLRPAGVSWPFFFAGTVETAGAGPLSLAQRALAAAASFARVEGEK